MDKAGNPETHTITILVDGDPDTESPCVWMEMRLSWLLRRRPILSVWAA